MSDLISVIIPTYQHAGVIVPCIDSVLAQTYPNVEIIIVDDGSTDNTQEVLEPYRNRVQIVQQDNAGSNQARMRGFLDSKGFFVIFCDADVVMRPHMLAAMHKSLQEHPDASYAYSGFRFGWKLFHPIAFDSQRLWRHNYIHTTSLIRRSDFSGFDKNVKRLQDWDVWLTMLSKGKKGTVVDEVLFDVRIDGTSRLGTAWMPSWVYALPWRLIGWMPERLRRYEEARELLLRKHGLYP